MLYIRQTYLCRACWPAITSPDHAPDMDVEAATRAQALLQINGGKATPDVIAVILGDRLESAQDHIAALGLTRVEQDTEL